MCVFAERKKSDIFLLAIYKLRDSWNRCFARSNIYRTRIFWNRSNYFPCTCDDKFLNYTKTNHKLQYTRQTSASERALLSSHWNWVDGCAMVVIDWGSWLSNIYTRGVRQRDKYKCIQEQEVEASKSKWHYHGTYILIHTFALGGGRRKSSKQTTTNRCVFTLTLRMRLRLVLMFHFIGMEFHGVNTSCTRTFLMCYVSALRVYWCRRWWWRWLAIVICNIKNSKKILKI